MDHLRQWLEKKLDELIDFPATPDLISYILEMENPLDIENYFGSLLDVCNPRHRQFIQEYAQRRAKLVGIVTGYKKSDVVEDYIAPMKTKNKKDNTACHASASASTEIFTGKKKRKQDKAPKERRRCECEAAEHKLINNCLKCGRIVCSVEGSGPCLFCGELVCTREERRLIEQSDAGDSLYQKLMDRKLAKGLEEALKNRDRLVDYDRNGEKRTTVIDDENDYFCDNSVWLTPEEREQIAAKKEELDRQRHSRLGPRKIILDFAGREVREDNSLVDTYHPDVIDDIVGKTGKGAGSSQSAFPAMSPRVTIDMNATGIELETKIVNRGTGAGQQGILSLKFPQSALVARVQDRGLLEMTDVGACLSIHQPWASLLVKGIKKEEGRTWYTPHRGKLWIASTSKQPTPEDIKLAQNVYGEDDFPSKLPAGCLLGCVLLVDCLPQEEYRHQFPDGLDDSPYVFICESPLELAIQFPMKGKPNIYKLDPKIHFAAQSNLSKSYALKAANGP